MWLSPTISLPPPPIFCRHSLQLFPPTLPKLTNWILLSPSPLSSDPDTPSKFGTCTKCHSDSSSACYFCYSQQHIVSSNPHINDAHFWKEQYSHTSRNENCKQALLAPSRTSLILLSIEFNRNIYIIHNEN